MQLLSRYQLKKLIQALSRNQLLRKCIIATGLTHLVFQILVWYPTSIHPIFNFKPDWIAYYSAATSIIHHALPYSQANTYDPHYMPQSYLYPPQFAILISPIGYLPEHTAKCLWFVIVAASFWALAWNLAMITGRNRVTLVSLMAWSLALAVVPNLYLAMFLGQADIIVWVLFAIALRTRNCAWMAVVMQIKPYYAWAFALMFYRGRPKYRRPAIITLVLGALLGLAGTGVSGYLAWAHSVSLVGRLSCYHVYNISASFEVVRLCGRHFWTVPFLAAAGALAPAVALWLARKWSMPMQVAVTTIIACLFSPLCWNYYLAIGTIPLAFWLRACIVPFGTTQNIQASQSNPEDLAR